MSYLSRNKSVSVPEYSRHYQTKTQICISEGRAFGDKSKATVRGTAGGRKVFESDWE